MKTLKKISLVYALQIFAVLLLFGNTGSSSESKMKEAVTNGIVPLKFTKQPLLKTDKDSVLAGKITGLWNVNTAKSW
jgi:hypothetical protein